MLWFTVWFLLVIGTLVGAFFVGRRLYRSGRALMVEMGGAAELAGDLAARVSEFEETDPQHPVRPVELADRAAARRHWAEAGAVRQARRARRRDSYRSTYEHWRAFSR